MVVRFSNSVIKKQKEREENGEKMDFTERAFEAGQKRFISSAQRKRFHKLFHKS